MVRATRSAGSTRSAINVHFSMPFPFAKAGVQLKSHDAMIGVGWGKALSVPSTKAISVLIADGHPVIREGLIAIFESQKDIKVLAEATDGEQTCELCYRLCPDVLLLDLRMPRKSGFQVITELASSRVTKPRIVAMSTYESEEDRCRALMAGADAYLVKGTAPQQIREAVRGVAIGDSGQLLVASTRT
jgi:DNA-binding response OmpR family regulator